MKYGWAGGIVRKSVYKNFRIMQIWAFKREYDSGPKMQKFRSRRSKWKRGRRKEKEEEEEEKFKRNRITVVRGND